jgi:hypothetical protein
MKPLLKLTLFTIILLIAQLSYTQTAKKDSLKTVKTVGVFDGKIITAGNFKTEKVYKINDYCISLKDITNS